jgi:hypothetical protein
VTRAKEYFIGGLANLPGDVLQSAHAYKLADRECVTHRVALSMTEIRASEQRRNLLMSIQEHRNRDPAANEEQLEILTTLLGVQRFMHENELLELPVVDEEARQI